MCGERGGEGRRVLWSTDRDCQTLLTASRGSLTVDDHQAVSSLASQFLLVTSRRNRAGVEGTFRRMEARKVGSWLRWPETAGPVAATLVLLHHAGGGASAYAQWSALMPPSVQCCIVQLPGRENRLKEAPFREMVELLDILDPELNPHLVTPYYVFGHSMGARIAFALAHRWRRSGTDLPRRLFLSATPAPAVSDWLKVHEMSDAALVEHIARLGGLPQDLLDHSGLIATLLPTIRADLRLAERATLVFDAPLECSISAFAGSDDPIAGPERIRPWGRETTREFTLRTITGGHFFIRDRLSEVVLAVVEDMAGDLSLSERGMAVQEWQQ